MVFSLLLSLVHSSLVLFPVVYWFVHFLSWFWTQSAVLERHLAGSILRVHGFQTSPVLQIFHRFLGSTHSRRNEWKPLPVLAAILKLPDWFPNGYLLVLLWFSCLLSYRHKYHSGLVVVGSLPPFACILGFVEMNSQFYCVCFPWLLTLLPRCSDCFDVRTSENPKAHLTPPSSL